MRNDRAGTALGGGARLVWLWLCATIVALALGASTAFAAPVPSVIATGFVTDAVTLEPIAGANVEASWHDEVGGLYLWTGFSWTDTSGAFVLYDEGSFGPGEYRFAVEAPGFAPHTQYEMWGGVDQLTLNFALEPVLIATGVVTDAETSEPIEGAYVEASWRDEVVNVYVWTGFSWTDTSGAFVLYDEGSFGPGQYQFSVWAEGYLSQTHPGTWYGTAPLEVNFALEPVHIATGFVTDAVTFDPIAGAQVTASWYDEASGEYLPAGSGSTNETGAFTVRDARSLGTGEYQFFFSADGYLSHTQPGTWDGTEPLVLNVALELPPVVAGGFVTDAETSGPIAEARVTASWYDASWGVYRWTGSGSTDESGAFTVRDARSFGVGQYQFFVSAAGYLSQTKYDDWSGALPLEVNVALEPIVIVRGVVTDRVTSDSIAGAYVEASWHDAGLDEYWWAGDDYTDATGAFAVYDMQSRGPGRYEFSVSAGGYLPQTKYDDWNGTTPVALNFALDLAPVDPPPADPLAPVLRVEGQNRFATAVRASQLAFPDGAATVVIATGRNWPDALGGTSLAGALDGPILLVDTHAVPAAVTREIIRLGATRAIILGGTGAVGGPVEQALKTKLGPANVERIAGANRYATADAIVTRVIAELGTGFDGTAFVATGANFPDALAAAPLAAAHGWPFYLANPATGLSSSTRAAMSGVTNAIVLGGEAAVSSATESALRAMLGAPNVTRLSGPNRYATAVAVATFAVAEHGHTWNRVGITTGLNFPDAVAGGVLQGKANSVMLLTEPTSLSSATRAAIRANRADIDAVTYFGGVGAVSTTVRNHVAAALK